MPDEEKAEKIIKEKYCNNCEERETFPDIYNCSDKEHCDDYYLLKEGILLGLAEARKESKQYIELLQNEKAELAEDFCKQLKELKEQIEKMKCCGNCKNCVFKYDDEDLIFECDVNGTESYTHLKTCTNWELAE